MVTFGEMLQFLSDLEVHHANVAPGISEVTEHFSIRGGFNGAIGPHKLLLCETTLDIEKSPFLQELNRICSLFRLVLKCPSIAFEHLGVMRIYIISHSRYEAFALLTY